MNLSLDKRSDMTVDELKLAELEERIRGWNKAYRDGNPLVPDAEYDAALDEYAKSVPAKRYSQFRATLFGEEGEVAHPHIMGSLEKVKNGDPDNSLGDWIMSNVFPNDAFSLFVSAKIDGCSLRLEYKDGKLVDAVTRGDGLKGFSIYQKAIHFVPVELPDGFTGNIRGECTLTHETFDELKSETGISFKNLRNATVGLVKRKDADPDMCRYLRFIAYHLMDEQTTKAEQFAKLAKFGFMVPEHKVVDIKRQDDLAEFCGWLDGVMVDLFNEFSRKAEYDMDGLVVNDASETDFLAGGKIPSNMIAFKLNQLSAKTTLLTIDWNISKSGYFTPVGIVNPVDIGGSTIGRVTFNNYDFVKKSGIHVGMGVYLLKSGDIIPKVTALEDQWDRTDPFLIPSSCPYCGTPLVVEGCELRCPNGLCPQQHLIRTVSFLKELGVKNYDTEVLKSLGVTSLDDLLGYVSHGSVRGFRLESAINKHVFGADEVALLSAMDWNGIGRKTMERMANHYGVEALVNGDFAAMRENRIEGVGDAIISLFESRHAENMALYRRIRNDQRWHGKAFTKTEAPANGPLSGMAFCVTGELGSMSREEFGKTVVANGGLIKDSVTRKVTHLVTNNPNSNSSKNRKAKELGIKVITEDQFLNMIGAGREDLDML